MSRTQDPLYKELGLADAAIGAVAKTCGCAVLTDDLDLYLRLSRDGVEALNFAHLQAANRGLESRGGRPNPATRSPR